MCTNADFFISAFLPIIPGLFAPSPCPDVGMDKLPGSGVGGLTLKVKLGGKDDCLQIPCFEGGTRVTGD